LLSFIELNETRVAQKFFSCKRPPSWGRMGLVGGKACSGAPYRLVFTGR
jgi:hypothetical protein